MQGKSPTTETSFVMYVNTHLEMWKLTNLYLTCLKITYLQLSTDIIQRTTTIHWKGDREVRSFH